MGNLTEIVVARCSPENKYKIIRMLQSLKHITGATGSKLSDCQALKRADVGIATKDAPLLTRECADVLITSVGEAFKETKKPTDVDNKSYASDKDATKKKDKNKKKSKD